MTTARRSLIAFIAIALMLAGCSSKSLNGSSSAPKGVDQATWDDYCGHGASLLSYITEASKGTITSDEFASKLNGSQNGIQTDADATTDTTMHARFQAITDAIGRLKVSIAGGASGDYTELVGAINAMPTCKTG